MAVTRAMYQSKYINQAIINWRGTQEGLANDLTMAEARVEYKNYLAVNGLVDTTPVNDVIGWIMGRLVSDHTQDAIVMVYGDRGVGKSYVCGYLGEQIDKRFQYYDGSKPGDHFTINNVRSVDPEGTLELLSPEQLNAKERQVFIIDDASVTTNARSFQTQQNQYINHILTTARIYRHCIIINTVASNLIDSVVRGYADMGILVGGVIPGTTLNAVKVYRMSHGNHMGFGKGKRDQFGKYFRLNIANERVRMTRWFTNKPSDEWCNAYDKVRKSHTDNLGEVFSAKFKSMAQSGPRNKDMIKEGTTIPKKYSDKYNDVVALYVGEKRSVRSIAKEVGGITEYGVNQCISEYNKKQKLLKLMEKEAANGKPSA